MGNHPTLTDPSGLKWAQQKRADGRTWVKWFKTDAEYEEAVLNGWSEVKDNYIDLGDGRAIHFNPNGPDNLYKFCQLTNCSPVILGMINDGALNQWSREFLMPGKQIDRIGNSTGKYFSPYKTPMEMRALPPSNTGDYNAYTVLKPFEVQSSTIAPAFGKIGMGTQYLSPVSADTLLKRGIITPIR